MRRWRRQTCGLFIFAEPVVRPIKDAPDMTQESSRYRG